MKTIDKLLKVNWKEEDIRDYIGPYTAAYFAYAKDRLIRSNAASGGVATAVLTHLLKTGKIDGALVCRSEVESGQVEAQYFIATSAEDLVQAQGSKYISTNFSGKAMPLIRGFGGKLAVTALPCDAKLLSILRRKDTLLDEKLVCVITLFCGHMSTPELTQMVVDKLRPDPDSVLSDYRFRSGHWRGTLMAEFSGGRVLRKKFSKFSSYQNLFYFCEKKCLHCDDHIGFHGDIAMGDVWLESMRDNPIKHSSVIAKTQIGNEILQAAGSDGSIALIEKNITDIMDSQARSLKMHTNISPRAKAGEKIGLNIRDTTSRKVRLPEYLVAYITLKNALLTQTPEGREKVARMSNLSIKTQLYLLKALEVL